MHLDTRLLKSNRYQACEWFGKMKGSSQECQVVTNRDILRGLTIILDPIFQSTNQGGSIIPWLYYPTSYKYVRVISLSVVLNVLLQQDD